MSTSAKKVSDDIVYGRQALRIGEPWIVPESLRFLESIVKPSWQVFEWGAGGSTIWFARNCAHITSIEHNTKWVDEVHRKFVKFGFDNYTLLHKCGLPEDQPDRFRPYANMICEYDDEYFDLIFVDGEASSRGWCITNAVPKLKSGGYLLVDNSDWMKPDRIPGWDRTDYVERDLKWVGKTETFNWWTSVFRKPTAQ